MHNTIICAIVVVMLASTVVVAMPRNNHTNGKSKEQYCRQMVGPEKGEGEAGNAGAALERLHVGHAILSRTLAGGAPILGTKAQRIHDSNLLVSCWASARASVHRKLTHCARLGQSRQSMLKSGSPRKLITASNSVKRQKAGSRSGLGEGFRDH